MLLVVDPRRLGAPPRPADPYGIGLELVQVVGPLPTDAVVEVVAFPPGPGGRWSVPDLPALA